MAWPPLLLFALNICSELGHLNLFASLSAKCKGLKDLKVIEIIGLSNIPLICKVIILYWVIVKKVSRDRIGRLLPPTDKMRKFEE